MDDIMGVSVKKLAELVLAILALVFMLIAKSSVSREFMVLICIMVAYLGLLVLMACARRDIMGGGNAAFECAAGLILLLTTITYLVGGGGEGLIIAAYICGLILGALFLIFNLF